jgi:hypothetical protein
VPGQELEQDAILARRKGRNLPGCLAVGHDLLAY